MMRRNQGAAFLFAILLFAMGAGSGVLADRYLLGHVVNAKPSDDFRQQYISEMKSKLKLSPDQIGRLDVILDETKARYKAAREQFHPQMLKIKNEQISRVKSILTPSQIPAYEQLVAERERRFKEQEERDRQHDRRRENAHHSGSSH